MLVFARMGKDSHGITKGFAKQASVDANPKKHMRLGPAEMLLG
jgi:hypothetical protein